jgi:tetratricopeptide (TPR) repeat protein
MPEDELVIRVLSIEERRYAVSLVRPAERDEAGIAARNRQLADEAEAVLRAGHLGMTDSYLIPRLIARDAYRNDLPPDPLVDVLRADLRFAVGNYGTSLADRLVDNLEQEYLVAPDLHASPRPRGDRRKARLEAARQAWAAYLFDRGMDHIWVGRSVEAEAYYKEALKTDPGHADAWVHLGNRRFEEDQVTEALSLYEQGQAAAEARTIGDPAHYPGPFWGDLDSRPFMRALHGRGLCLWRLGRTDEARQVFAWMLELNPNDNQGVRFLVADMDEGLDWEESVKREESQE